MKKISIIVVILSVVAINSYGQKKLSKKQQEDLKTSIVSLCKAYDSIGVYLPKGECIIYEKNNYFAPNLVIHKYFYEFYNNNKTYLWSIYYFPNRWIEGYFNTSCLVVYSDKEVDSLKSLHDQNIVLDELLIWKFFVELQSQKFLFNNEKLIHTNKKL